MTLRRNDTPKPSSRSGGPAAGAAGARRAVPSRARDNKGRRQHAGVSLGTASNVLNRPDRVAPDTLARVLGAIDKLGFVAAPPPIRCAAAATAAASAPSSSTPRTRSRPRRSAASRTPCTSRDPPSSSARRTALRTGRALPALARGAEGPGHSHHPGHAEHPPSGGAAGPGDARGAPRPAEQSGRAVLGLDRPHAGRGLGAALLFDLGHRLIAFINGPLHLSQCAERRRGMRRAARNAGLNPDSSIIEYTIDPITASGQAEHPSTSSSRSRTAPRPSSA